MRRIILPVLGLLGLGAGSGPVRAAERAEFTLDNGLRVRLVSGDAEKKAVVLLGVRAGFLDEPAGVPHLAHVTEHLVVFGARQGSEQAKVVDGWFKQSQANGETLADFMYFDLHVPSEEVTAALKVQAARLKAPEFLKETLAREVPRTLGEVDFVEKSAFGGPAKFALAPFVQAAYHGKTDEPLRARTRAITVDQVGEFHARTFRPDRAILTVVGDFDPAAARKTIEAEFKAVPKPAKAPAARPALKAGTHKATWDVSTRHLMIAWPTPAADQADHAALTLASFVLTQRMFTDTGLQKLVKMPMANTDGEGLFLINAQLQADADPAAAKAAVLERVAALAKEDGLKDAEVDQMRAGFRMLTEPPDLDRVKLPPKVTRAMARANGEIQRMMREIVWGDLAAYGGRVDKLKAPAVREAVGRHLDPKKACVVEVAPR